MNILTLITTLALAILASAMEPCFPEGATRCYGINEIQVCERIFIGLYWEHAAWCWDGHMCVDPNGDPQCVPAFNYCRPFCPKAEVGKITKELEAASERKAEIEGGKNKAAGDAGAGAVEVDGADGATAADSAINAVVNADATHGGGKDTTLDSIAETSTIDAAAAAPSTLVTMAAPTSEKRSDQPCYQLGEQRCYGWSEIQVCKEVNGGLYWQHGAECLDFTVCVQPMFGEPRCEQYLADCWPWCSEEEKLAVQKAKNEELAAEAAAAAAE